MFEARGWKAEAGGWIWRLEGNRAYLISKSIGKRIDRPAMTVTASVAFPRGSPRIECRVPGLLFFVCFLF